jgi:ribosome biogenesis GTPase
MEKSEVILKDDLQYCFREFEPYLFKCRFTSCAHIKENGCKIREAAESGDIPSSRYESYKQLYESIKNLKEWEINN